MIRARYALLLLAGGLPAQQTPQHSLVDLQHGRVTIWVVRRATAVERQNVAAQRLAPALTAPATFVEKTPSEFGQSASDFGQTAGSYGQTSGSFGTNASDTGQTAGSAGKGPSELGQTAGSYGQTAGSYGKTAGEFGRSTSDVNLPVTPAKTPESDALPRELNRLFGSRWPGLQISVTGLVDEELKDRLAAAAGSAQYPDIVVGALPGWWRESGLGLTMLGETELGEAGLGEAGLGEAGLGEAAVSARGPEPVVPGVSEAERALLTTMHAATILRRAPHPAQARALLLWLQEDAPCVPCGGSGTAAALARNDLQTPVATARAAWSQLLSASPLGALADAQAASFSAAEAQRSALQWDGHARLGALQLQTEVTGADANQRLAVVGLRTVVSSAEAFGVVYAVVVLRRDALGAWKALQVAPSHGPERQLATVRTLQAATGGTADPAKMLGVSLAAPIDGDTRSPRPELWWDNRGGAVLQAVEWQADAAGLRTNTRLALLDDRDPRLQTRVVAAFATEPVAYRWRVWSLARDGTVALSPWRTFLVVGR